MLANGLIAQELFIGLTSLPMQTEDTVGQAICSLSIVCKCIVCKANTYLSVAPRSPVFPKAEDT